MRTNAVKGQYFYNCGFNIGFCLKDAILASLFVLAAVSWLPEPESHAAIPLMGLVSVHLESSRYVVVVFVAIFLDDYSILLLGNLHGLFALWCHLFIFENSMR